MPCWSLRRRLLPTMSQRLTRNSCLGFIALVLCLLTLVSFSSHRPRSQPACATRSNASEEYRSRDCNASALRPMIFIGGMPRSGTTLMRAIIDSHPLARCGEETRVVPRILSMRAAWKKSPIEWNRLMAGGMTEAILDSAVRAFVYEILVQHSQSADVLCDKDPFVLKYASYVASIFPNSKFLFVVRDARAVIHSVMTRKVTITGFSFTDYRQNLRLWNKGIETMSEQCEQVGARRCLMVHYEQLVLQPKRTIQQVLKFLDLPWTDSVLHHEELVGKKISLSKTEHSSDQVIKPINLAALTTWFGHVPADVRTQLDTLAPMLKKLGYDTQSDTPTYGTPDSLVLENMDKLKDNAAFWQEQARAYARQTPRNH